MIGCADCQPKCFHSFILSLFLSFLCWSSFCLYAWCPSFESYFFFYLFYPFVFVCYPYVTRMYSYVTRVLPVCTRMYSYVIGVYPYVLVCYSYVVVCYSSVLLWCFGHHRLKLRSSVIESKGVSSKEKQKSYRM